MLKQSQIKTCLKCGQENPSWVEFTREHHSCPPVLPFPSLFSLLPAMLCFALTPISHEFSISVSDSHKIFHFNTTLMFTKRMTWPGDVCGQGQHRSEKLRHCRWHQEVPGAGRSWGVFNSHGLNTRKFPLVVLWIFGECLLGAFLCSTAPRLGFECRKCCGHNRLETINSP